MKLIPTDFYLVSMTFQIIYDSIQTFHLISMLYCCRYTGEAPLEDEDMMLYGDEDKDDDEDGDDEDDDEDEGDADEDEEEDDVAGGGGAGAKKKSPAAGKRKGEKEVMRCERCRVLCDVLCDV